jgi:hypothetical protein
MIKAKNLIIEKKEGSFHPLKDDKILSGWNGPRIAPISYWRIGRHGQRKGPALSSLSAWRKRIQIHARKTSP